MFTGIQQSDEIGLVCMGPLAVLAVFSMLVLCGLALRRFAGSIPDGLSLFINCFGIMTCLDWVFILIVDLCYGNYGCTSRYETCKFNYTAANCNCFNGDFVKLWYRMTYEEGTGMSGLLITMILYVAVSLFTCALFYEYLLYIHRDGRIIDLWRRVRVLGVRVRVRNVHAKDLIQLDHRFDCPKHTSQLSY